MLCTHRVQGVICLGTPNSVALQACNSYAIQASTRHEINYDNITAHLRIHFKHPHATSYYTEALLLTCMRNQSSHWSVANYWYYWRIATSIQGVLHQFYIMMHRTEDARDDDCTWWNPRRPAKRTARDRARTSPRHKLHEIGPHRSRRKPDSTRTATCLKLEHSFLDQVIFEIKYFVNCLTFLLGFLVSTSLPRFSNCLDIHRCFYKPTDIHRCFDSGELTNCVPRSCLTITSNSLCIQYYLGILFGSCYIRIWFLCNFLRL
jgi:hypothetical protein